MWLRVCTHRSLLTVVSCKHILPSVHVHADDIHSSS